jgi:hypothetical protein
MRILQEATMFPDKAHQNAFGNNNEGIKKNFSDVFENFPGIIDKFYKNKQQDFIKQAEKIYEHFIHGSTMVKHHGFHEEKEVRIVVAPRPKNNDSTFYMPEHDSKPFKIIRYAQRGYREGRYPVLGLNQ